MGDHADGEPAPMMEVREIRAGEHAALGRVTVEAYLQVPGVAQHDDYLAELADVTARAALVPVLVAVDAADGRVLGGVAFVPGPGPLAESEGPDEAGFRMLAVAPEAQGRGVGRALVEACVARARAAGKRRLVLLTLPTMTAAHSLYASMGFTRESAMDWEFEPGHWLWGFAMALGPLPSE
jgi:ribosomal protein S18 acetylase RimI-like enzyme